jgi:hypothetical protein
MPSAWHHTGADRGSAVLHRVGRRCAHRKLASYQKLEQVPHLDSAVAGEELGNASSEP